MCLPARVNLCFCLEVRESRCRAGGGVRVATSTQMQGRKHEGVTVQETDRAGLSTEAGPEPGSHPICW